MADDKTTDTDGRQRLDRWLFFARITKSRSLAQAWISAGHVRVNATAIRQPAHRVKFGDTIEVAVDRRSLILSLVEIGTRRGPFEEARKLYEDISPPVSQKDGQSDLALREKGSGRPTKRERRMRDRWLDFSED